MPIQDAIDLARFLVETTIGFIRSTVFLPKSVGGVVEIAAITKHEGFRWVTGRMCIPQTSMRTSIRMADDTWACLDMIFASAASLYAPVYLDQVCPLTWSGFGRSPGPSNGGFTSCVIGM
jgi:hypothetical protein